MSGERAHWQDAWKLAWGRLLVSIGLAMLVCVAAAVFVGGIGVASSDGTRARRRSSSQLSALLASRKSESTALTRAFEAKREARLRWLGSPAAISQRATSSMAFHGYGPVAARNLLMHHFGSTVNAAAETPSIARVSKAPVLAYLNPYEAEVRGPRGIQDVHSMFPLAHSVGGRERPVDLRLKTGAAGFAPANASGDLMIDRHLSEGVALGTGGLRVSMEGKNVPGVPLTNSAVFYGGVGSDVDATVAPTDDGVEFFATLRSRVSPEELRYRLTLPTGASLRSVHGSVDILRAGRVLAVVTPPTATDAQGQNVPSTLRVLGDQLVLTVEHRSGSFAYPTAQHQPQRWRRACARE
jgi:hypothetical protein